MKLSLLIGAVLASLTAAHTVISYPGWRGNNLIDNETFPYGMQWMYPCKFLILAALASFFFPSLLFLAPLAYGPLQLPINS